MKALEYCVANKELSKSFLMQIHINQFIITKSLFFYSESLIQEK